MGLYNWMSNVYVFDAPSYNVILFQSIFTQAKNISIYFSWNQQKKKYFSIVKQAQFNHS